MLLDDYRPQWANEELDDLRSMARDFMEQEVKPNIERWAEQHEIDRDHWYKAGDAGLLCISIPEEYGGGGGDFTHEAVVLEEQARVGDDAWGNQIHSTIIAHYILAFGTEEQKQRWLPKMATGEFVASVAMTEPAAGSDLQALNTKAELDGDHYVVNGSKTFISNASHCDLIVIVARTSDVPGGKGLSLLVAETQGLEGFDRGRILQKIGQHGQDTRELSFTDMRVPAENILGGVEGKGMSQLMSQLPQERLILAVSAAAMAETAVRETIAYTKERTVFGQPVMEFQNTKFELAECATDTLAAKAFVDHCVAQHVKGALGYDAASAAKYWASDMQNSVIDRCLQLFGGYGFMMEYPIARMYAGARVQKIYGGTNEVMKELISRSL